MYENAINIPAAHTILFQKPILYTIMFSAIIIILLGPFMAKAQVVNIWQQETVEFQGRQILFVNMQHGFKNSWYEALTYCVHQNMDLVSIDSPDKNKFITSVMPRFSVQKFWIGLKSDLPETVNEFEVIGRKPANFHWIANNKATKLAYSYSNWCPGYPKLSGPAKDAGNDVCGAIRTNETCWKAYDCIKERSIGHAWICEDRIPKKTKYKYARYSEDILLKNHRYTIHHEVDLTWNEAEDRCNSKEQTLVSIQNNEELKFIQEQVKKKNLSYWIGLTATEMDKYSKVITWNWILNTNSSNKNYFNNWCNPDRTQMGINDHCAFIRANGLCWQNWDCDNDNSPANGFICKDE